MKLLVLCGVDATGQGGAPRSTLDLAVALKRRGHEVRLAGDYSKSPEEKALIRESGVLFEERSMRGLFRFPTRSLRRWVRSDDPDMVISTHRGCDIMTFVALSGMNVPRASVVRMNPESGCEKKLFLDSVRNSIWYGVLRRMDLVIGISDVVTEGIASVIKVRDSSIVRIYNAIDTDYFQPVSDERRACIRREWSILPETRVVLVAGRIEQVKRPMDVLPIAEKLAEQDICFVFSGDGSLRQEVEQAFHSKGLEGRVLFLGMQSNMVDVYGGCDILLHTGQDEALGRVVAESYACGKPVVCVNRGGVGELVEHGVTGYLFEPGDSESAARSIRNLASDGLLYASMCGTLRNRALELFSIDELGRNVEAAVLGVLDRKTLS